MQMRKPLARAEPEPARGSPLWAVVLAGGEGVRLRALTRRICGDQRPKQYVALFDGRSLLDQTLDRVARLVPRSRTVVVTLWSHSRYFSGAFTAEPAPHVLVQPADRGTGPGVLFPSQWIAWRDPGATVVIVPSDHFVLEEAAFMDHVRRVADWVGDHPDRLVLLGARPTGPEVEYGWIELGGPLDPDSPARIWAIRRFWEKPSPDLARACLEAGCLWNTFVVVAQARTLLRAGEEGLPEVADRLGRIGRFWGTASEGWAVRQAYALMPEANFSRAILAPAPACLAVSRLPDVTWSDLGSPRRVMQVVTHLGLEPAWAREPVAGRS
jgi:mannose-1-phosphate guanylyltransferase